MSWTKQQFAEQIKNAYPNATTASGVPYTELSDDELTQKVIEQYPVYKNQISDLEELSEPIPSKDTGFAGVATGVAKGGLSTLRSMGEIGSKIAKGTIGKIIPGQYGSDIYNPETESGKKAIEFVKPQGFAEKAGFGLEKVGEFVAGGIKVATPLQSTVTKGIMKSALSPTLKMASRIGATSAIEGVTTGGVTALQGGTLKDVLRNTIVSSLISVPFKALEAAQAPVSEFLKKSAIKKGTQALAPTTKANKELAEKTVPEMLKRKVTYVTRSGLESKAAANADELGSQIGDAFDNLPSDAKTTIAPIFKDIEDAKETLKITGTNTVPEVAIPKYQSLQRIQKEILDLADEKAQTVVTQINNQLRFGKQIMDEIPESNITSVIDDVKNNLVLDLGIHSKYSDVASKISKLNPSDYDSIESFGQAVNEATSEFTSVSSRSLRSFRQILDKAIKESGKGFGFTGSEKAGLLAQKEGANAIRDALASDYPDIAALNKEYTFWRNVEDLVGSTIQRTKGHTTPIGESAAEAAGAAAGYVKGGTLGKGILTGVLFKLLKHVITSPAWRNTSAIIRNELANFIASGEATQAEQLLNRIITGTFVTQ